MRESAGSIGGASVKFSHSVNVGKTLLGIPESVLAELQRIGAMTMMDSEGEDWYPGLVLWLNGEHPVRILGEITREQFNQKVLACGVRKEWLKVPPSTRFWEISID